MNNKLSSKVWKRAVSFMLVLVFTATTSMYALADTYYINEGSISVTADDTTNYVTQANNPDVNGKADDNVVITGTSYSNTITVDAGASVTLNNVEINLVYDTDGQAPLTVTDNNPDTDEAATIIMNGSRLYGADYDPEEGTDNTPGILVEDGASLDLQISGYNSVVGGDDYSNNGNTSPGIQLNDGSSITISDNTETGHVYGQLDVEGGENDDIYTDHQTGTLNPNAAGSAGIGTANGSSANVTININQNRNLEVDADSGRGTASGAAIGTGANSEGKATISINGGVVYAIGYSMAAEADAIGDGAGAARNSEISVNGITSIDGTAIMIDAESGEHLNIKQIMTIAEEDKGKGTVYKIVDRDALYAKAFEYDMALIAAVKTLYEETGLKDSFGNDQPIDEDCWNEENFDPGYSVDFFLEDILSSIYFSVDAGNQDQANKAEAFFDAVNDLYDEHYPDNYFNAIIESLVGTAVVVLDVYEIEPDQPVQPDEPDEPDEPDYPDQPDEPDQPVQPDQPAEEPVEEPAAAPVEEAKAAPNDSAEYISAGGFAASFVSAVGEYVKEVEELKGDSYIETFENFKAYVEKNKLFDTAGLTSGKNLTAGQIAVVLLKAADITVSNEEEGLAMLQEKGILKNRTVDSPVPVGVAQTAIKQFAREFLAG